MSHSANHTCATCRHGSRELWQILRPPDNLRHTVVYCHHPAMMELISGVNIMYADEGGDCTGYEAGQQVQQLPLPKVSTPDAPKAETP